MTSGAESLESDAVDNIFSMAQAPAIWEASNRAVSAEIERQIATAKKFPRTMKGFMTRARDMALCSRSVAESCFYTLPRRDKNGKFISGPSIRLAEIVFTTYWNLRVSARITDIGDEFVAVEGVAHDLESNSAVSKPVTRRIVDSKGRRYNLDMIGVTQQAAVSLAIRNAIFTVVPRALINDLLDECRATAIGKGENLEERRAKAVAFWAKQYGVSEVEMCSFVGVAGIVDLGFEHLADLVGLHNAIKDGVTSLDEIRERARQEREDAEYAADTAGSDAVPSLVDEAKKRGKKSPDKGAE